jgi:hypothetical protein
MYSPDFLNAVGLDAATNAMPELDAATNAMPGFENLLELEFNLLPPPPSD